MVQVKVHRISSVTDPNTGLPAKQIELVEVRQRASSGQVYGMGAEENRLVVVRAGTGPPTTNVDGPELDPKEG